MYFTTLQLNIAVKKVQLQTIQDNGFKQLHIIYLKTTPNVAHHRLILKKTIKLTIKYNSNNNTTSKITAITPYSNSGLNEKQL